MGARKLPLWRPGERPAERLRPRGATLAWTVGQGVALSGESMPRNEHAGGEQRIPDDQPSRAFRD
jgi:hypothetical protein